MPKLTSKKIYPLLITVLLFLSIYLLGKSIPQENIRSFITGAGPSAPLVWIILSFLTYIIAPLSGAPVLFVGFYAFGNTVVIYNVIATFLASITNFYIARTWGKALVGKFVGRENMKEVDKLTKQYGFMMLF